VLIEQCTFIPVEKEKIKDSPVMDIVFASGDPLKPNLITHGFGNIYNHGQPPNIAYRLHPRGYYEFFTLRDVEPHTELCSSYGRRWWAQRGRQPLP
jgi:SET domain-containing protein